MAAGRADLGVRQRLGSAEGEAVPRAAARSRISTTHTVTLVKQFTNPTKTLLAESQGNTLNLSGADDTAGNWLMGYGGLPNFTEYDSSGHVLLDGTLGKNVQSFRTYLQPWSGQAPGVPSVAVSGSRGRGELERRHERRLLAGARGRLRERARTVAGAAKTGFQTTISLPAAAALLAVQALDATGAVLGTSPTIKELSGRRQRRRPVVRRCAARRRSSVGAGARGARLGLRRRERDGHERGKSGPSCVPSALNVSAALAGARVTVSPAPGTRDASSATQISFLGGCGIPSQSCPTSSSSGSRSGAHAGRLLAYSQGDGASFVPAKPFTPASWSPFTRVLTKPAKRTPFAWSFTVAVPDDPGSASVTESTRASSAPAPAPKEFQSFHSRPDLRPPDLTVSSKAQTATGDLFLAPYSGVGQYGPMILDEHGNSSGSSRCRPPARARRTSACSSTKASRCSPGGRTR